MKTKRELAQTYFPLITADSAVRKLTCWINNCKPLARKLSKTGYKSGTHTLSDRQISMIFDYLGEPWVKKRDPLLSPCKGEAGYLFRLRSFLKGGLCIWPPPYRGKRGGLSFFLFIYFSLYIKKKINKNNNKWCGKSGKGGISYWCSIRIVIYTLWINGGDMCGKGNDKCGFLHMMKNG